MASHNQNLGEVAEAFDRQTDPLQQYEADFADIDTDLFQAYIELVLTPKNPSDSTLKNYRHTFDQWKNFMANQNRHPACPNEEHVKKFASYLRTERGNSTSTIKQKRDNLGRVYEWWQDHYAFPHPSNYNPFNIAKREMNLVDDTDKLKYPHLTESDISQIICGCTNIRERLFLICLLKLGMRVGEFLNIRLEDISVAHSQIRDCYPELGTAPPVSNYENCIYIPSKHKREGNKSSKPRILPLDDELRQALLQYLTIRPRVNEPWLILSQRTNGKINRGDRINNVWKKHFQQYNQMDGYRTITTHYGRHYFTRYWKIQEDITRELVQYMRGDKLGDAKSGDSIDDYLEAYYEDIESVYLNHVPKFL
ncbi:tyrosine-type recombinase/integrase [Haloarcula marismortui]|uniref:Integrase family protein n=1 Tax=Haloarcula marismortui ATCC 33799 TaxID=662475 RepID=M0KRE0_9EURY|nr:site-specific integrase [Haloarcula californiae]EMA23806.1 integrase family protein [Haloarcula californiae ATCC 33799]